MTQVPNPALVPPIGAPAPVVPPAGKAAGAGKAQPGQAGGPSFADVLAKSSQAASAPHFTRHALERLQRRGIDVGPPTLQRLNNGIERAAAKGSRDSVVLVDGTAFVVSVANNTVITAVNQEHMREHVFTNIDSAVIA